MQRDDLLREVEHMCKVSAILSQDELRRCYVIAMTAAEYSRENAVRGMAEQSGMPILQAYINDGWSAVVREDCTMQCGEHLVKRQGKFRHEFLLERVMIRWHTANGDTEYHMLFGAPRGLRSGKRSDNVLSASADFCPTLRAGNHEGIAITMYVSDTLLHSATLRLQRARHIMWYDIFMDDAECDHKAMEMERDWVVGMRCKAHTIHNSLLWGLGPLCNEEVLDDTFLVISSLINGSAALHSSVDATVLRATKFVERANSPEDLQAFWQALEVSDRIMPLFMELDPMFEDGRLCVSKKSEEDPYVYQKLATILHYGFRWFKWSKGRWVKSGRSARFFVRSIALGAGVVMQGVLDDPEVSNFRLTGFNALRSDIMLLMGVISQQGKPVENMLCSLLKDDRYLMHAEHLQKALLDDLSELAEFKDFIWTRLASVVGVSAAEMRTATLYSAVVAVAFIDREVHGEIKIGFCGMTQGDIEANIDGLIATPLETLGDPGLRQLKRLLTLGESPVHVHDALLLLKEGPCTSCVVEEGHASAAVLKKWHEDYSENSLAARALMHQQRALFRPSSFEKKVASLEKKMDRQLARQPQKIYARQAGLAQLTALELQDCEDWPGEERRELAQECMKELSDVMAEKSSQELMQLRRDARKLQELRRDEIQAKLRELRQKREAIVVGAEEALSGGIVNSVASARFKAHQLDELCEKLQHAGGLAFEFDEKELKSPGPLSQEEAAIFKHYMDELEYPPPVRAAPWWSRDLCYHREHMRGVAFRNTDSASPAFWLFMYGKASPYQLQFLELRPRDVYSWPMEGDSELVVHGAHGHRQFDWFHHISFVIYLHMHIL